MTGHLRRAPELARLGLFYLPVTVFWTLTLTQWLPARLEVLAGDQRGLALAAIGGIASVAAVLSLLIAGPLSDATRHPSGRRLPWIVGGTGVAAIGIWGLALAPSLLGIGIAFLCVRVGLAFAMATYGALVPEKVPGSHLTRATAWSEGFDLLGQIVGLLLSALLIAGAAHALLSGGPAAFVAALHSENDAVPGANDGALANVLLAGVTSALLLGVVAFNLPLMRGRRFEGPRTPLKSLLRSVLVFRPARFPDFSWLFASRCVLNCGTYTALEFLRYFLSDHVLPAGADPTGEVIALGLCVTAGRFLGAMAAGSIGDRFSKRRSLIGLIALAIVAACGFLMTRDLFLMRALAFLYGIGLSAISTIDWAFAAQLAPPLRRARFLAIFQTSFILPQAWVLVAGGLIGHFFGFWWVFATVPFYLAGGALLLLRVREPSTRRGSVVAAAQAA